jgi:hypothetical protein
MRKEGRDYGPQSGIWLICSAVRAAEGGKPINNSAVVKHAITIAKYNEVLSSPAADRCFISDALFASKSSPAV